jgi:hypothetical protein
MNICPHIEGQVNLTNDSLSDFGDEVGFAADPATVYFLTGFLAVVCVVSILGKNIK